jgi:hypothetical protein
MNFGVGVTSKEKTNTFTTILLRMNVNWIAVAMCVLIPGVRLGSSPRSLIVILFTMATGASLFYARRHFLGEAGAMSRDVLISAAAMTGFYSTAWAIKIFAVVVMVCMAKAGI